MTSRSSSSRIRSAEAGSRGYAGRDAFDPVLDRLSLHPRDITKVLRELDTETRARFLDVAEHVGVARASALDSALLAGQLIDRLGQLRDRRLIRVSVTVPPGPLERDVAPTMRAYAGLVAETGAGDGALLALDCRPRKGDEHAYGVVVCRASALEELQQHWCDETGALVDCTQFDPVSGWDDFVDGADDEKLRRNLRDVIRYGFKPLPDGRVRDLDSEVVATGSLRAPWEAFRAKGGFEGSPEGPERLQAVPSRGCGVCGKSMPVRKRADAKFCSERCRMLNRPSRGKKAPPA